MHSSTNFNTCVDSCKHHQNSDKFPKTSLMLPRYSHTLPSLRAPDNHWFVLCGNHSSFQERHVNDIMKYGIFCNWLLSSIHQWCLWDSYRFLRVSIFCSSSLPNSISLYGCPSVCSSILPAEEHFNYVQMGAIMNRAVVGISWQVSVSALYSFLEGNTLGQRLLGNMARLFNLVRNC